MIVNVQLPASKLREAVDTAEDMFWRTLSDQYPEITTGDFDGNITDVLLENAKHWVELNYPIPEDADYVEIEWVEEELDEAEIAVLTTG